MNEFTEKAISAAMRLFARGLGAGRVHPGASGLEHIPPHGPALLIARHYHHLFDGIVLLASLQRPIHILVTLDWAQGFFVRNLMIGLTRLARWPVILRREALGRADQRRWRSAFTGADIVGYERKAIRESVALLARGHILVIFPEGYPNIDPHYTPKSRHDEMLPFKSGFVTIATAAEKRCGAKIPLIPVGFRYTVGKKWTAHVRFGAARSASDFVSREALVNELERDVARLSDLRPPR
jgi:putative membrane protein